MCVYSSASTPSVHPRSFQELRRQHDKLSLTIGLLVFLLFDTVAEALNIIATTPGVFGGAPLIVLVALLASGALIAVGTHA